MGNVLQRPAGALNSDEYIILVGNIPWRGRWQDLKDLVREITANVQRVEIYTTADGRSRGFGYIIVKDREEAAKVAERLDGFEWHGRALMVKLGNEANPVPVLAQQPSPTSSPDGPLSTEYVPVPPLPTDYNNNNANNPAYSNLVASQLAAYNEWIAIQAYHHYSALAHNIGVVVQEERSRILQRIVEHDHQPNEANLQSNLQSLSIGEDPTTTTSATQERDMLLEEYNRQASIAQRAATFHSTRHHVLLQEERSRYQDNSPPQIQSSSSSSPHSSSSPFSMIPSRRGTPSQPNLSKSPVDLFTRSSSQSSFHPSPGYIPMLGSSSPLNMQPYAQRAMSDQSLRRGSYPYFQSSPLQSPDNNQQLFMPQGYYQQAQNIIPGGAFNFGEMQLFPSFYQSIPSNQYQMHPSSGSSSSAIAPARHGGFNRQSSYGTPYQPPQSASVGQHPSYGAPVTSTSVPPTPMFVTTSSGVPVNLTHGAVQTENRGIFIGNLPYNTHWRDLRNYLAPAGTVIRCDVPRKPNNKGRGYATVLFSTTEEANHACEMFNGTTFQGRQIRVRLDTYANTKGGAAATADGAAAGSGSAESGSGGQPSSSFFTDGDVDHEGKLGDQTGRKSSASV